MSEPKLEDTIYIFEDDPGPKNRVKNEMYFFKNSLRRWTGERFNCIHNKKPSICSECDGKSVCPHKKERWKCRECEGSAICKHNRRHAICKLCKGASMFDTIDFSVTSIPTKEITISHLYFDGR